MVTNRQNTIFKYNNIISIHTYNILLVPTLTNVLHKIVFCSKNKVVGIFRYVNGYKLTQCYTFI